MARPTIVKTEYVKKLETAFNNGANVSEACSYAGISRQVFYNHLKGSAEFFDKMQTAVYSPKLKNWDGIESLTLEIKDVKADE